MVIKISNKTLWDYSDIVIKISNETNFCVKVIMYTKL
jgi:hypothetical protein